MLTQLLTTNAVRQDAFFAAALAVIPAGVLIVDATQAEHPVIFVNEAFTAITGYSAAEVMGRNCRFLQGPHTDPESVDVIRAALAARQPVEITLLNYRRDRTPFWNELRIAPLSDAEGAPHYFVALLNDVTAARATQQALTVAKEQAERATGIKSNFLAMMSHEIRTPINGILGTLALLNEMPLAPEARRLAELAHGSGETLLTVINDLLDFSKIEAGKMVLENTVFDLPELLQSIMQLMQPVAERKHLKLALEADPALPRQVSGDPNRIRQILFNLISNALKFTERGGVMVKASNLLANADGNETIVRFEVSDTGIGMSAEGLTRIFTEFNQLDPSIARRYGGTGLGLAICKRLVTMMHGEIAAESRLGEGSRFHFVMPLSHAVATAAPHRPALQAEEKAQGRILIVEDNEINQLVLGKMLERAGHVCDIAADGAQAIVKVRQSDYDLVFMDVSMPVMDGLAATRLIRELGGRYRELPIVAMTAQTMPGDRERCLAAGMNDFLSKPVKRDLLDKAVQQWLRQSPPSITPSAGSKQAAQPERLPFPDVIDWPTLRQMADDVGMATVERLLGLFAQDMEQRLATFRGALAAEDWQTARQEAHTLKSSSASCGLASFAEQLQLIEKSLAAGDKSAALTYAAPIDALAQAAQNALRAARHYYQGDLGDDGVRHLAANSAAGTERL